jgi:glycine hydroxymethyltransferase
VPKDAGKPGKVSGIRLGSGAVSARGMSEPQMSRIVELMDMALMSQNKKEVLKEVAGEVLSLCKEFPISFSTN